MQIRKKVLGEEHSDTAESYNNMGVVHFNQGEYEYALVYFIKTYKIFINKFGFNHPHTKIFRQNIELVYMRLNPEVDFERWLEEKMKG